MPLTEEMPKFAVEPVSDMKTPTRTLSPPAPLFTQALNRLTERIKAIRIRFIQFLTGLDVWHAAVIAVNDSFQALLSQKYCRKTL
jgi:hypothetical protein